MSRCVRGSWVEGCFKLRRRRPILAAVRRRRQRDSSPPRITGTAEPGSPGGTGGSPIRMLKYRCRACGTAVRIVDRQRVDGSPEGTPSRRGDVAAGVPADGATDVSMDKSLICTDDSSKKTDPYGELKVFAGSSSRKLGAGHLQPPGHGAGPVGDDGLQRGERLRPRAGERPRPRRLHRPGHRLPGQRQLRRAALLDRRLQACQRHAGHRGHPVFLRTPRATRRTSRGSRSAPGSAPTASRRPGPTAS